MYKSVQFALAMIMFSAVGCAPDIMKLKLIPETRVAISGIVIDGETSEPVKDAEIKLEENKISTDNDGFYKISDILSGEYKLMVNKNGYKKLAETVNLSSKKVIDIMLYKTSAGNASSVSLPYAIIATPPPLNLTSHVPMPFTNISPLPTVSYTPTASPTYAPIYISTIKDIQDYATIRGMTLDDANANVDGVTLIAKSLNTVKPFSATVTSSNGAYSFTGVPTGITIEITASKPGYTTRIRTVVPLNNTAGGATISDVNFGQNADGTQNVSTALSDKPEVTGITPNYNTAGVDPATKFILKFSESMDNVSVEDNFIIIDEGNAVVASKDNYTSVWNLTKDEVIFAPKGAYSLPKAKSLAVSFKFPGIKDSSGQYGRTINLSASDGCFRVTSIFKGKSPFTVAN